MKCIKIIFSISLFIFFLLFFFNISYGANTVVSDEIQKVRAENTAAPVAPSGAPRIGWIGSVIDQIFDTAGRIQTQFIAAFENVFNTEQNGILKWTGTEFAPSLISEDIGEIVINGNMRGSHIYANDNTGYKFISGGSSSDVGGNLALSGPTTGTASYRSDIRFRTDDVTRMTIDGATGNVGIGISSPTTKLDVAGDIKTRTQVLSNLYCNEAGTECFSINNILKDCELQYRGYHRNGWRISEWSSINLDGTSNVGPKTPMIWGVRVVDDDECDGILGCGIQMRIVCN